MAGLGKGETVCIDLSLLMLRFGCALGIQHWLDRFEKATRVSWQAGIILLLQKASHLLQLKHMAVLCKGRSSFWRWIQFTA